MYPVIMYPVLFTRRKLKKNIFQNNALDLITSLRALNKVKKLKMSKMSLNNILTSYEFLSVILMLGWHESC